MTGSGASGGEPGERTLLVTGFSAFGEHATNPAGRLAEAADGLLVDGVRIAGAVIPVTWAGAFPALHAAVSATAPSALLMFGVAGRPEFNFEVVARNRQGSRADADGAPPPTPEVVPGGPLRLVGRMPWSRLSTGGAAVVYSNDAGDYLCNHLLYRALHAFERLPLCGFVHVPPLPDSGLAAAMPWEALRSAGLSLVRSLARALAETHNPRR